MATEDRPPDSETASQKGAKPKIRAALKLAGLALGIALIYFFLSNSNLEEIWGQVSNIGWRFVPLTGVMFLSFYIDTVGWKLCFPGPALNVSLADLFMIRLAGESLAQINPTNVIAGDTMKAVLLKRDGVNYTQSIVSLAVYRFITFIAAATFVIAGVFVFFDYIGVLASKGHAIAGILAFFFIIIFIFYRLHSGRGIFSLAISAAGILRRGRDNDPARFEKLRELDRELVDFFRKKKTDFLLAYICSVLHRLPEVLEYWLIFSFLGIEATVLSCLAISVGVTFFKFMGSFIPGQLGIEEYGNKVMMDFIKVPGSSTWLTVSILRRARQIVWIVLGMLAFLYLVKIRRDRTSEAGEGPVSF